MPYTERQKEIRRYYRSQLYIGGKRGRQVGPVAAVHRAATHFKVSTHYVASLVRNL